MKSKGYIFDLVKLENGWIVTLFSFFSLGYLNENIESKFYKCFQISISKLQLTFSIDWSRAPGVSFVDVGGEA